MKVLFAVGNDQLSKNIADKYYEKYGEVLEYKNVFYFKALIEEVKRDKTYNRIVINEEIEEYRAADLEQIDRKTKMKFTLEKVNYQEYVENRSRRINQQNMDAYRTQKEKEMVKKHLSL